MPRLARKVIEGFPHHVTQRGVRRGQVFFKENDYRFYLDLLGEWSVKENLAIWAYCLMPNHVHIIAAPERSDSLRRVFSQVHKRYSDMVNKREACTGHLWQERFASFVMDESYALQAVRYVEMNPVAANMVAHPQDYRWSSARGHLKKAKDPLLSDVDLLNHYIPDWDDYLRCEQSPKILKSLAKHMISGKPLGSDAFLERIRNNQ